MITEMIKIELAHEVLNTLGNRSISVKDGLEILDLATKTLKAKKRKYDRKKWKSGVKP